MSRGGVKIAGQRFGRLVAIEQGDKTGSTYRWRFRCDCGRIVQRVPSQVRSSSKGGASPCCKACKSANHYVVRDGIAEIDISTKKHKNVIALIDKADLSLVLDGASRWHARHEPNNMLYASRKHQSQTMHRLIMGFPEGMEIDHINGNSLDNRRCNLRIVTRRENARNSRRYSRNKTGIAGVSEGQRGGYVVYAMVHNKNTYLGTFDSLEEAAAIRRQAEKENGYHPNHGRLPT